MEEKKTVKMVMVFAKAKKAKEKDKMISQVPLSNTNLADLAATEVDAGHYIVVSESVDKVEVPSS